MIQIIGEEIDKKKGLVLDENIQILSGSSKLLLYLINDILDYCQFKHKGFRYIIEIFNVLEMIHETFQIFKIATDLKGLKLIKKICIDSHLEINSDRRRIMQVLMNLINNAIKFTQFGEIIIKVYQKPSKSELIYFEVIDTGSGIPDPIIKKLGTEYSTFGQTSNENKEGIGLGLFMSNQFIQKLGPYTKFKIKTKLGSGSTFKFAIFIDKQECNLSQNNLVSSENSLMENASAQKIYNFNLNSFVCKTTIEQELIVVNQPVKILIVDDSPFNLYVLKKKIEKYISNLILLQANNGQEAVEIYKQQEGLIDIIFIDCQMPILNGYEATSEIRAFQIKILAQRVIIIGLTANNCNEVIQRCEQAGMDKCYQKPLSDKQLINVIKCIDNEGQFNYY